MSQSPPDPRLPDDHPLLVFARNNRAVAERLREGIDRIADSGVSEDLRGILADITAGRSNPRTLLANDEFGRLLGSAFEKAQEHYAGLDPAERATVRETARSEIDSVLGPEIAAARRHVEDSYRTE